VRVLVCGDRAWTDAQKMIDRLRGARPFVVERAGTCYLMSEDAVRKAFGQPTVEEDVTT